MRYILSLLPVFPFAILITGILYAIIYNLLKSKREKPSKGIMLAEYVLLGWVVMFIYVTQIMSFGNGLGDGANFIPLQQFVIAIRYGSNNAGGVWQFLLNIIMFIPLGFLLPIVFKKHANWKSVFIISLSFTVATELLQLISSRGTDIDDVIANTLGGLCGFALYLIIIGLISLITHKKITIAKYISKLLIGIIIIALISTTFVVIKFCDGSSKYGNLYYEHLIPKQLEVNIELDDSQNNRAVYKYEEQISLHDLEDKLQSITNFNGEWTENTSDETYYSLFDGENKAIFIFPYNKWSVYYEYGVYDKEASENIDSSVALEKAWEYLKEFDIDSNDVVYDEDDNTDYSDENYHFNFLSIGSNDTKHVYGNVTIEIGKDGRLVSICDNRVWCTYFEDTQCISMKDSIKIAKEVGCGDWYGNGVVESVEESYTFIPETGYLIPIWLINGYLDDGSQVLKWQPKIDAVK